MQDSNAFERCKLERFLNTRPHPFTRCDITVLIPNGDGTYLRGSYNQNELAYPASTVKLTYMVSALEWCKKQGYSYDCLDTHVRPMIYTSDNFETGVVVDFITETVNYHPANKSSVDPTFQNWLKSRNFTQTYLDARGLLEDQVILSKTYPSNSGPMPSGAEAMIRELRGQNMMKPKCAAALMAEITGGYIHPEATKYMKQMLQHARYSYTALGKGLPPGSVMHNKIGNAYDTLEEISHVVLPNGKEIIMAIYTNGYEPSEPDVDNLSFLADLILQRLPGDLTQGIAAPIILSPATDKSCSLKGNGWSKQSDRPDKFGTEYWKSPGSSSAFALCSQSFQDNPSSQGLYEISAWAPENSAFTGSVAYNISHAHGVDLVTTSPRVNGGRWVKLGDFNIGANGLLINVYSTNNSPFFFNAIKLARWPYCNKTPGTPCPSLSSKRLY